MTIGLYMLNVYSRFIVNGHLTLTSTIVSDFRYLYGQPVSLSSVGTARATLEVAHRYLCPGLLKVCVNYLDQNLTPRSVLEVFQNLRYFCSGIPSPNLDPSAPSIKTVQQHQDETNKVGVAMIEMCDSLLLNCLLFIDENADEVLEQEIIEELSFEDIAIVAPRDTLRVTCETKLFNALSRWCVSECKRCKKELTSANRRQVLGQLSYSVRYLLMTEKEFIEGPRASELLDLTECDLILRKMRGEKNLRFTEDQSILLYKFATPRLTTNNIQPIILSERSLPRNPARVDREVDKIDPKKLKKQRKKAEKEMKKKLKESEKMFEESNGCSCTCFGDSLLRAFVCIFD